MYTTEGRLLRQVNHVYKPDFEHLNTSGLGDDLHKRGWLISHTQLDASEASTEDAYCVLEPELLPFISYPGEWCFSQLKEAALLTLEIQKLAISKGMVLKDASAYNVQFIGSRPVFIDTLSFEILEKGKPWVAYRQFCQHFLAPLLLAACTDERLTELFETNIDGIPLDLAARVLPLKTRLRPSIYTHIVLHSRIQQKYADSAESSAPRKREVSEMGMRGLIENLQSVIRKLEWKHPDSEWGDYYDNTNYDPSAMSTKEKMVDDYLRKIGRSTKVIDAGANTGRFSAIASQHCETVIALDVDWVAVDKHYQTLRQRDDAKITPLRIDLTTPTPAYGWANEERPSLVERCGRSTVLALALIHHLAISNNVPLTRIARFFASFAEHLIIEFVPKSDSQVERLLATREDIFADYHIEGFRDAFSTCFEILEQQNVSGSDRTLLLLRAK